MEALNDLRQDIDALDAQLAALYRRRMDVAARIAAVKREQGLPVLQPEREREIRARLAELAAPALQPGMQAWFEALRAASRDWQESSPAPGASLRCGLLGEHLRHSYSPEIHAMLGAYSYDLFEIPPEGLADFLHGAAWDGLNVTIPYKRAVVPFCTALSPMAKQTGSVNTLVRRADGTLYGANTDAGGFRLLLERGGGIAPGEKALVLGSGGASQTVQAVLRAQGAEVVVISRRGPVDYGMIEQHADVRLVVNATPVGMYPENGVSPLDLRRVPQCRCVLDLVYNPARTALLQQADRLGLRAENGLSMLAEQARCAAGLFLQRPVDPARTAAVTDALQKRMRSLILIGMPGAGKTTVGRLLAQRLGRDFFDADDELVRRFGCDIPTFFAREGEAAFRAEETALLAELGKRSGCVIATGGGCVTRPENEPLLRQNAAVIWLQRALDRLPVAGRPVSRRTTPEVLYAQRAAAYARFSDGTADNNGTPDETVRQILEAWT